jgi:hypothetical protein
MFNAGLDPAVFAVAAAPDKKNWFRAVDTSLNAPDDIVPPGSEKPLVSQYKYTVKARSMIILLSKESG